MPFILDMAPVYKGFHGDIGYSGSLGAIRYSTADGLP